MHYKYLLGTGAVAIAAIAALILLWPIPWLVEEWMLTIYLEHSPGLASFLIFMLSLGVLLWSLLVGVLLLILCLCAKTGYGQLKAGRNA